MEQLADFITENYVWIIIIGIVIVMTIIGYFADKTNFGKKSMKESKKEKNSKKEEMISVEEQEEISNDTPVVAPAFDTDEMVNMEETSVETPVEEPVLDKKTLKRMQKEEEKRLKQEAKELKKKNKEEIAKGSEMEDFYAEEQSESMEQPSSSLFEPMEDMALDVSNIDLGVETPVEEPTPEVTQGPDLTWEDPTLDATEKVETKEEVFEEPVEAVQTEEVPMEALETETVEIVEGATTEPQEVDALDEISKIELPSIESLDKELDSYEEEDDVWKF